MTLLKRRNVSEDFELDEYAVFEADKAFIASQRNGETKAKSVRAAIKAYLKAMSSNPRVINF